MNRAGFSTALAVALCLQSGLLAQETVLENAFLKVVLSDKTGAVTGLTNKAAEESYRLTASPFVVVTTGRPVNAAGLSPKKRSGDDHSVSFTFTDGDFAVDLHYRLAPEQRFLQKWIVVRQTEGKAFALKEIVLERATLDPPLTNAVKYYSYAGRGGLTPDSRGCPTALFLRSEKGGLILGIENPFFRMAAGEKGVRLSYRPMLRVMAGESYTSEREFIGVYKKTERFHVKQLPKLSGWSPERFDGILRSMSHDILDWAEIWAMQEYMDAYMPATFDRFRVMLEGWWSQLPSLSAKPSAREVEYVCALAANLREIGVNLMGLTAFPGEPPKLPELASTGWEMNPNVDEVIRRERPKGMRFGLYLGDASAMGPFGNSGGVSFLPEKEAWKKRGAKGRVMRSNCLGCDEFAEWFFKIQDSTIQRYELGWWQWDGGIGTWHECHADNHRHLPGASQYAEWRARMALIRKLKEAHPDLWIHIYWGLKPYGPWGLKWVDTHENYFEMGEPNVFPTISADRWMADDGRLQFWWNQNARFIPHYKNYGQVGHGAYGAGTDGWAEETARGECWEESHWKYALLSVIGTCGGAAINVFPNDLDSLRSEDFRDFYKKWLGWANEHCEYVKVSRGVFGPPRIGAVDGYCHIIKDRGFVFLFNPNQRDIDVALPLDEQILLTSGDAFVATERYPCEGRNLIWKAEGVFARGSEIVVSVPAEEAVVLEIRPDDGTRPLLFGVPGTAKVQGEDLIVSGVKGEEGSTSQILILVPEPRKIKRVRINDREARFGVNKKEYIRSVVQFAGVRIVRELDNWDIGMERGERISIPNEKPLEAGVLHTRFFLPAKVKEVLAARKPRPRPSGKPTPLAADASRLLVSLPFTFPHAVGKIAAEINGKAVPIHRAGLGRFIDITEEVLYDRGNSMELTIPALLPGQFLGPRFENVPLQTTDRFKVISERARTLVKIGPPPQKPFWDGDALAVVQARMRWAVKTRGEILAAYHKVRRRDDVPHKIHHATMDRADEEWGSENVMDDETGGTGGIWCVRRPEVADVIMGFGDKAVTVRGIHLFNNAPDPPKGLAKDFAVFVSSNDKARGNPHHPSWKRVFRGRLEDQSESFQEFEFPPTAAKYVRLRLIDNYLGGTIGIGEMKLVFE